MVIPSAIVFLLLLLLHTFVIENDYDTKTFWDLLVAPKRIRRLLKQRKISCNEMEKIFLFFIFNGFIFLTPTQYFMLQQWVICCITSSIFLFLSSLFLHVSNLLLSSSFINWSVKPPSIVFALTAWLLSLFHSCTTQFYETFSTYPLLQSKIHLCRKTLIGVSRTGRWKVDCTIKKPHPRSPPLPCPIENPSR